MKESSLLKNPKTYTLASVLIGFLLIGDLNPVEQNALGNFFLNIGQILEGNAAIAQALESNNNTNNNDEIIKALAQDRQMINELQNMINKLNEKLKNL